ncbi:hypothetical protein BC628DRAFT_1536416 [Trametes gibbosa]|nr:hypothetical protein BC628DRAFT_1536416 [Trametes gibbosa]
MTLLDLPDELLVVVASQLRFEDLVSLQQVCHRWHSVVGVNATLQYAIELRIAGKIDNPASCLVPGERLRALRAKEEAWRTIDLSDRRPLTLGHRPSGIYDLTGGILLLGERRHTGSHTGTDAVHTMDLHSVFSDSTVRPRWSNIDLAKQVIDVGLAIQEHDLIAIATYSYVNEAQLLASVDIHLFKHSTGQPHPAAAKSVLHFGNIRYLPSHCGVLLEITGDSLCFLLNNYFPFINADPVTFVVYNWKTGVPVVGQKRIYSDPTMFNSFVLLSSEMVALPIIPSNALEICQFTDELKNQPLASTSDKELTELDVPELKTVCILELPPLRALVLRMTCRCEPNPRGPSSTTTYVDTQTPFYSDPERAVMVLHMHLRLPTGITRVYTMIVHRSSLLKVVRTAMNRQASSRSATKSNSEDTSATLGKDSGADEGEPTPQVEEDNELRFTYDGPPRRHLRSSWLVGADPSNGGLPEEHEQPIKIPWLDWGPAVTRWFKDELSGTRWITTTCGQRLVRARPNGRLRVFDFNQLAIKRYAHGRSLSGCPIGTLPGETILAEDFCEFTQRMDVEEDQENEGNGDEESGEEDLSDWELEFHEAVQAPAGSMAPVADRQVNLVLGRTMVEDANAWEGRLESGLPYLEMSVPVPDEYESVLLDEDIILGLKMENDGRHIQEIALHRIGGCAD